MKRPTIRYLLTVLIGGLLLLFMGVMVSRAQPPFPHPVEGRDDCLGCHEAGVAGAPRVAADHVGRTNETCDQCHRPIGIEPVAVRPIPHPVEGRDNCLACHESGVGGASPVPADHAGRTNETCGQCHVVASTTPVAAPYIPHSLEGKGDCLVCHREGVSGALPVPADHAGRTNESCRQCHIAPDLAPAPVPPIPHSVEEQEACLICHGVGIGEPLEIPEDHVGRPNEICQTCHQPPVTIVATPAPPPSPTPIQHPEVPGENSCLECHSGLDGKYSNIANQWEGSVHATYNVTCADCHGGDPGASEKVAAKSPEAGYFGRPARSAIPALCGSCHADPERMHPYELPVDQLREYEESVHGQRLAQGDENTATCYDCHGGHAIKDILDPTSSIHPRNLPATCAYCHADEERMKPYGIATDQYDLYQTSVHGVALLEEQNLGAPSCPTCHSSHGAALPGYAEVIDVCGQCHSKSEEYYLTGGHRHGRKKGSEAPRCIDCHGRYDAEPASLDLFVGDEPRHCGSCHASGSLETAAIDAMYQTLVKAEQTLEAAEEAMDRAQTLGLSLDNQEARLEEARTRLAEAAAAQHELKLETIKQKTTEVKSMSAEIQEAVKTATSKRRLENWVPAGIIAAALGLGGLIVNLIRRRAETI
jgi:hypothetical protein